MSQNGKPPAGEGGVEDPEWIDRILDRATAQAPTARPIPAEPEATGPASTAPISDEVPIVAPTTDQLPEVRPVAGDGLAEIRWVDTLDVAPAATSVIPAKSGLTAQDAGRSAWADELAAIDDRDPQGWDKLSWQDLEEREPRRGDPIHGKARSPFGRVLREWGPVLIAAVTIAVLTRLLLVQAYHIPSLSMAPTLEQGDRVIVNRLSYRFGDIERGQVVVFAKPANAPDGANDLIKRVIGLPGETITINGGNVFVDGFLVEEPYLASPQSTRPRSAIPGCAQEQPSNERCVVPEGYIFVMGDNRAGSSDSRVFGPIPTDTVVGRAFVRVWPFNSISWL